VEKNKNEENIIMADIELKGSDAALVFRENGSVEIVIPTMDDDANVPDHIHTAVCIGALIKQADPVLMNYCQQQYDVMWKKANGS